MNDKASSIFNISYAGGCLIAPILGGALNDSYKFRTTCDILAVAAASFAVVYFLLNILPFIIDRMRNKPEKASSQVEDKEGAEKAK